jgi:octaprenyl-diphosphate synthase
MSSASSNEEETMATYGMHVGTAFQLIDDVLDFSGHQEEIGKNLGDDLAEGKPTLPLLYAMRNGNDHQKTVIRNTIEQGGLIHLEAILQAIAETKALDYVRSLAATEAERACVAIRDIPDSIYKQALINLAKTAVDRRF